MMNRLSVGLVVVVVVCLVCCVVGDQQDVTQLTTTTNSNVHQTNTHRTTTLEHDLHEHYDYEQQPNEHDEPTTPTDLDQAQTKIKQQLKATATNDTFQTASGLICKSNDNLPTDNLFLEFFNDCLMDSTEQAWMASIGWQIQEWFDQAAYLQYMLVVLVLIPIVAFKVQKVEPENVASANHVRLQCLLLLFRVALAVSLGTWLQPLFQQQRPCLCKPQQSLKPFTVYGTFWGLPPVSMMSACMVGWHVVQYVSPVLGIAVIIGVGYSVLVIGVNTVGQVCSAFLIAGLLHVYQVFTPILLRPIDFVANALAGCLAILLARHYYGNEVDFSFTVEFFNGIAWMSFAIVLFFVYFDYGMGRNISKTSCNFLTDDEFLYYSHSVDTLDFVDSSSFDPQRPYEHVYTLVCIVLLFCALALLRVWEPYINDTLNMLL